MMGNHEAGRHSKINFEWELSISPGVAENEPQPRGQHMNSLFRLYIFGEGRYSIYGT